MARIALIHDKIVKMGEPERVLEAFSRIIPEVDLYSMFVTARSLSLKLELADIQTTWVSRLPGLERFYRQYALLYPFAIESIDLTSYDLVLSNCLGFAKGVRKRPDALHLAYCHSPMLWAWQFDEYCRYEKLGWLERKAVSRFLNGIKRWDRRAAQRPDYILTGSRRMSKLINQYYGRVSIVIPPPVDINRFPLGQEDGGHYLLISELRAENRIELTLKAFESFPRKLIIIGEGPEMERLQSLAGPGVRFFGKQPESVIKEYVSHCRATIFCGAEELGRPFLEINGAGRPVIAYQGGVASEVVIDGRTGVLFRDQNPQAILQAVLKFEETSWDKSAIRAHAEQYDYAAFTSRLHYFLRTVCPSNLRPATEICQEKAA